MNRLVGRLHAHWVPAALCCGLILLALAPVLSVHWSASILLIYLQLPVYMLHQVEEHSGDRFKHYVNAEVFGGREALTDAAILIINIPGVWAVALACLYAAVFIEVGWGLTVVYLVLVNAAVHIVAAVVTRRYNPGLWTAIALFVPLGGLAAYTVSRAQTITVPQHTVALTVAIAIHLAIVVYAKSQVRAAVPATARG